MIYEEMKSEIANRASSPENLVKLVSSLLDTGLDSEYLTLLHSYVELKLRLHRERRRENLYWTKDSFAHSTTLLVSALELRGRLHTMRDQLGLTYASHLRKRFFK